MNEKRRHWKLVAATALAAFLLTLTPAAAEDCHGSHEAPASEPAGEELGSLNIPDVELFDQNGERVRFKSDLVDGKVVAVNFIFTTCTTICPPMGASFGKLQRELGERAGRDVHLISVSIDPTTDTPARLKSWAGRFGTEQGWTLVTGTKPEVDKLLKALQVFTPLFTEHSPILLVGNGGTNDWTRAYGLAPPADVLRLLDRVAAAGETQVAHHAHTSSETGK